jgi:Peptidase family M48
VSMIDRWGHRTLRAWVALSLIFIFQTNASASLTERNTEKIKKIIDDLKRQLGIPAQVLAIVVPNNALVVSVQPLEGRTVFQMSFEETFLNMLDEDDMRAVIAHELGHVWIFTHHPYLHTEELANRIAYKAVTSDSMNRVYEKLRSRQIAAGSMAASMRLQ